MLDHSQPTVLYVDDDEFARTIFERMLQRASVTGIAATSGSEALQILQELGSQIDLVFMDLKMPAMNGIQTVIQIRLEPSFQSLPIVLITAASDVGILQKAHDAGVTQVIMKPITQNTIHKLLTTYELIR